MYRRLLSFVFIALLLSSCQSPGADAQGEYPKVKEITLDVLHTEEGKKVLLDLMSESEFQQQMITTNGHLEQIVKKSISDETTKKEWQKILSNEEVATQLAKASENQQKQLLKTLMKDPAYQKAMLDLLKDPQFSEHLIELMNSQAYREEAMKILEETLQVPSFQEKLKKLVTQSQQQSQDGQGQEQEQPQEESASSESQ